MPRFFISKSIARATTSRGASSARSSWTCMKRLPSGSNSLPPSPRTASLMRKDLAGAGDLPFLPAGALAGDEVDGDVLLEGFDIGVGAHAVEQAGLHRMAGGVGCMHPAAPVMAAIPRRMQA